MKTNLIYAFRNIKNNWVNSTITVFGLAVAIACSLIIYFYVSQEYSYNSFLKNADSIYRINYKLGYNLGSHDDVRLEPELAKLLPQKVPQIEKSAEYRHAFEQVLAFNNSFYDAKMSSASEDFFNIFDFDFIIKPGENVFTHPYEIVITKTLADKLISADETYEDLMDKTVEFPLNYGNNPFQIVGILADIPKNSTIQFDAVVSGISGNNFGGCDNNFGYTSVFYLVKPEANHKVAEGNVNTFLLDYYESRITDMQNNNQLIKGKNAFQPFSLAFNKVHTEGDVSTCFESSVNKRNFIILITIGILILIIACSNYTILSLGQYLKKIGDVGIRKAMGANSRNIFNIFLSEGFILTFLAFSIGLVLSVLFIPIFGKMAQTEIYIELINTNKVLLFSVALFFGISLFTSIIPVFVFSKVTPHQMASNKLKVGNKSKLSQVFVSFQYSLSIILIIVTVFIVRQANFLKNKPLGIDTQHIINIDIDRIEESQKRVLVDLLKQNSGIINLTQTSRDFMNGSSNSYVNRGDGEQVLVYRFEVDEEYVSTLGLNLIYGEDFTRENVKDGDRNMIVNQKFLEACDFHENPVGKAYRINGINFTIIGVVADYHFEDMKRQIQPAALFTRTHWNNGFYNLLVKFKPQQLTEVKKHIEECYEKVAPGKTLVYTFWDEKLNQRYEDEDRWSKIIGIASVIAIIISSLGLFGLTILLINQRVKEIGVRKVNGAKASEVLLTINKSFIGWLMGSLIIAMPIAYIIVNKWLNNFPFKVGIDWWVFILAGTIAMLTALITVSWQSWKAASRNPVEALRYE